MDIIFKKNDSNGYDLYHKGEFLFSITEEDYLRLALYEKTEYGKDEIDALKKSSDHTKAKSRALEYQSYKLRTSSEVLKALKKDGYSDSVSSKVVKDLKSEGYINDLLYVKKYVFDRNKQNPKARRMLEHELKTKGIEDGIIQEGLAEFKFDNIMLAVELINKKYKNEDFTDPKTKRKVYLYLKYRGFGDSEIKNALKRISEKFE